jgi:hypothetical protein
MGMVEMCQYPEVRLDEIIRLRAGLREAASHLKAIADREEDGPFKDLFKRWEMKARQALEGV